ncbi:LPS export ABC transporter permease LptG [bacterium]|nr:LPS export ABC transporter permease LptG [bacterium]
MKIHDKYILSSFWKNIFLGLLAFTTIYLTVDFNEKIDDFIDHSATVFQVVSYYFFETPWIILLVLPVAVLLGTVFSLGKLSRDNEVTALISSGIPLVRIAMPLILSAFLISVFSIGFNEIIVPCTNHRAEEILHVDIEKIGDRSTSRFKKNLHYQGKNNMTYYAEKYDTKLKALTNVIVQEYNGSHLKTRVDAKKGFWNGTMWVFIDGVSRSFSNNEESTERFSRLSMPKLEVKPSDLARKEMEPEEMNFVQLKEYIDKIKRQGGSINKYRVDLYFKFSFPFTSLLFTIIGTALSASKRKPSMATGFGLTLLISFTYYGILRLGQAFGKSGVIHPLIGAWSGNIIFLVLGGFLLYKANK